MYDTTTLIKHDNLEEAVRKYTEALDLARESYNNAQKAGILIESYCAGRAYGSYPFDKMPDDGYQLRISRAFWRAAFVRSGIYELCSDKMRQKFDKEMEGKELPDFTMENIKEFFLNLDTGSIIRDRIQTTWEYLRPHNWNKLKTNEKNKGAIGTKIILSYVFEQTWDGKGIRLRYHAEGPLRDCENTFRFLDGKPLVKHPEGIVTAIAEATRDGQFEAENEYFHIKGHLNGNAHIILKRADIVQKLNQVVGKFFLGAGG